jgi:hypothetical protein
MPVVSRTEGGDRGARTAARPGVRRNFVQDPGEGPREFPRPLTALGLARRECGFCPDR